LEFLTDAKIFKELCPMDPASEQISRELQEQKANIDLTLLLAPRGWGAGDPRYLAEGLDTPAKDFIVVYPRVGTIMTRYDVLVDVTSHHSIHYGPANPSKRYLLRAECVFTSTEQDICAVTILKAWAKKQRMPETAPTDTVAQSALLEHFQQLMARNVATFYPFGSPQHVARLEDDLDSKYKPDGAASSDHWVEFLWDVTWKSGDWRRWRARTNLKTDPVTGSMTLWSAESLAKQLASYLPTTFTAADY